jgi:hypothetical protein
MEDVLDLYAEPYQAEYPTLCFDEFSYQLIREVRKPLQMQSGKPKRYDYEYSREGTCNMFMIMQPLAGWRHVKVTERRTNQDFAKIMSELVYDYFPKVQKIRIMLDNLSTHTPSAFYQSFTPDQARYMTKMIEFHYTPKHSSWLNMAEIEISTVYQQCLDRRLGSMDIVKEEVLAWENERNTRKAQIDWQFTIPHARNKLKRLYPNPSNLSNDD